MKMFWIYITGYCGLLTSPYLLGAGSTKTWNPESGNGNGITGTETETEYGIRERRFQAIDLKKIIAMTIK